MRVVALDLNKAGKARGDGEEPLIMTVDIDEGPDFIKSTNFMRYVIGPGDFMSRKVLSLSLSLFTLCCLPSANHTLCPASVPSCT